MFPANLTTLRPGVFAGTPTFQEEFRDLCDTIARTPLSATVPNKKSKTGLTPAQSSLNGNTNVAKTTTDSSRFA